MEHRPAPPVTIEGGPGWQVEGPRHDVLGDPADEAPRRRLPRLPSRAGSLLLAVAVGAAGATAWHAVTTERLRSSDAGVLSLEATGVDDVPYFELVDDDAGRLATVVVVALRNTGPRDVELQEVELLGTGFAAEDVDGVRVRAASSVRVVLLRALDCAAPLDPGTPSALRVRARTEAGEVERRVRVVLGTFAVAADAADVACGRVDPVQALQVHIDDVRFTDTELALGLQLRNTSAHEVVVRRVRPAAGLRATVTGPDGVPLPLRLPAGDYTQPRRPIDASLPTAPLVLALAVEDCAALPTGRAPYEGGPLVELDVDADTGAGGSVAVGAAASVSRLRAQVCTGA